MKEQLEDFDYEKAKANPELVRFNNGEKTIDIFFTQKGDVICTDKNTAFKFTNEEFHCLKLAKPKEPEMYVNYNKERGFGLQNIIIYESKEMAVKQLGTSGSELYKLVKVEENENI